MLKHKNTSIAHNYIEYIDNYVEIKDRVIKVIKPKKPTFYHGNLSLVQTVQ